ncbi:MAG TPA: Lrp/AsnC ligand binding domain-containing protein [Bacteroidia bacterium]|nr:Lrp/AsnC ligand binding domain-containing protein [Bacteroidia bacterium]
MPSAFLLINCKLGSDRDVMNRLSKIPVVIEVYRVYGAYDIIVKVSAETVEKLQEALKFDLKGLDNVVSTVTLLTKEI